MLKLVLIPLVLAFVHVAYTWQKYECDTPFASHSTRPHENYEEAEGRDSSSQDSSSTEDDGMGTSVPTLWKDGLVKYKLDASLTKTDIKHVKQAMNEYSRKTCIRFEKYRDTDEDVPYTTISTNSDYCSYASECQSTGDNFATFGKHCRHVSSMIHALGHNLCLGHEHQRTDRNNYVSIEKSCESDDTDKYRKENHPAKGIYDYASQMHETCGECVNSKRGTPNTCGPQVSPGISVMDADFLNSEYNCKGCYSHRWKHLDNLQPEDVDNLAKFGQVDENGKEITPCRAIIGNGKEVAVGAYDEEEKKCRLFFNNQSVDTAKAEVLTIPGGLLQEDNYAYQLISVDSKTMPADLLKYAVPSGSSFDPYLKGYIAYYKSSRGHSYVGKVWRKKTGEGLSPAKFFINNQEVGKTKFYILLCSKVDHEVNATSTATSSESTSTTPTSTSSGTRGNVGEHKAITKTLVFNGMTVKIDMDPNQIANEMSETIDLTKKTNSTGTDPKTTRQDNKQEEQRKSSRSSTRMRSSRSSSN